MKQKKGRFISVRIKILWSLVFVSVPLMIAVVLITYYLSIARVKRIGMQLSAQYAVSAAENIKVELRSLYSVTDDIVAIWEIREMAQLAANVPENTIIRYIRELSELMSALRSAADARIRIPMTEKINSLNASNAAAVILYEARRQRDLAAKS